MNPRWKLAWAAGVFALAMPPTDVSAAIFCGKSKSCKKRQNKQVQIVTQTVLPGTAVAQSVLTQGGVPVGKIAGNIVREVGIGASNLEKEARKGAANAETGLKKSATDVERSVRKSGGDVGRELKATQREVEGAATAVYRFAVRQAEGSIDTVRGAEKRFREGKVLDAVWSLGVTPLQNTSDNAAQIATENALVGTIMSASASVYGGPGGAAAYAAWLTYNQTGGDVNAALRVGLTSALKSYAADIAKLPNPATASVTESFKQAAIGGALSGLAVAAGGGSPADVQAAMLATAGSMLVQDGYQALAKTPGVAEFAKTAKQVYCIKGIADRNEDKSCPSLNDYVRDATGRYAMLDPKNVVQYVDLAKEIPGSEWLFLSREEAMKKGADIAGIDLDKLPGKALVANANVVMRELDKVKNADIVSLFEDRWAVSYTPAKTVESLKAVVAPAVLLSYTGVSPAQVQASAQKALDAAVPTTPQEIVSCIKGAEVVRTAVAIGKPGDSLQCAVISQVGGDEPTWTWYAKHDAAFCQGKMLEVATRKLGEGFACTGR